MTEPATVLVVDDEPMVLSAIDIFLSLETPHRVVSFSCPQRALEYLKDHAVDVVVSDYLMGHMCGREFLRSVAELQPDVPRVLLTDVADERSCVEARQCRGLFGFLEKPWCNEELRTLIERAVAKRRSTPPGSPTAVGGTVA